MTLWKPIIAGVDASIAGASAATMAWRLAHAARTDCILVHGTHKVSEIPAMMPAMADLDELTEHLSSAARQEVEDALRGNVPPDALGALEVRLDHPNWALRHAVEEHGAGLVVLGGKHRRAPTRWLGGSTAHHAVRTLDVPVMVTAPGRVEIRRVLVAADLSYAVTPTLEMALRTAKLFDAELMILHVIEGVPEFMASLPVQLDQAEYRSRAEARFAEAVGEVLGDTPAVRVVLTGSPADVITEQSAVWDVDLVVVGSHGKGWVDRVIIGSTTERLLNRLPTNTLVVTVRAPKGAATTLARGERAGKA